MTNEEIKKALVCCCGYDANCDNCPNAKIKGYGCKDKLLANAHNLINEQEKEIEKQKQIIGNLNGLIDYANKEIRKLRAENKILKADFDSLREKTTFVDACKIDDSVIDEMIEELKKCRR